MQIIFVHKTDRRRLTVDWYQSISLMLTGSKASARVNASSKACRDIIMITGRVVSISMGVWTGCVTMLSGTRSSGPIEAQYSDAYLGDMI